MHYLLTIIIILLFSLSPLSAQWAPKAEHLWEIGRRDSVYSKVLDEVRDFWVHLPTNYELSEGKEYPVVYIVDGSIHLNGYVNYETYHIGEFPEMIVVGISNRENRTRDLTPTNIDEKEGTQPWIRGSGGGAQFTSFVIEELIPHIDEQYPTTGYRTLIGHSFGGLFTVNMLMNHSEWFDNYLAFDPSLWWDEELMLHQLKGLKEGTLEGKSLFLSIANNTADMSDISLEEIRKDTSLFTESMRANLKFIEELEARNRVDFEWKYYGDENHQSVPLVSMVDGLDYLFGWFAFKGSDLDLIRNPESDPIETIEAIVKHYEVLSEQFGYTMLPEEEMINGAGYMFLEEAPEKAYQFFKLNMENYPDSPNVYDSMADYYIAKGNYERALYYLEKALEISGDDFYRSRIMELKKGE